MLPKRSELARLREPDFFLWATGIEDTFIVDPWHRTNRTLDEYELTRHYDYLEADLDLMKELGVPAARYGIPWYKVNPARGRWDWAFPDRAFELLLDRGIEPIVDLVHYGTPDWLEHEFLEPDYPACVAEYAARVAERYKGRIRWYTPLNEPRVTAWYSGKVGWWPPYRRGWRGFLEVLLGIAKGVIETIHALRSVDPEIVIVNVDPGDVYVSDDPGLQEQVILRNELVYFPLQLVVGQVGPDHPLADWVRKTLKAPRALEPFHESSAEVDIAGINLYPMYSLQKLTRARDGLRIRRPYADRRVLQELAQQFHGRFKLPVMITETASVGRWQKRQKWLEESLSGIRDLRSQGVPVVGYTWWPMFSLFAWAYRQQEHPLVKYKMDMGLWDLSDDPDLNRIATPMVSEYKQVVEKGHQAVGVLRGK